MRTLMTGIAFGESTRWGRDGRVWFADWGTHEIIAVDVDEGREGPDGPASDARHEVVVRMPGESFQPICFDFLPDGRPLIVASSERRLVRRDADGTLATYADLSHLSNGGFNEIVVDGRGNAYVNGAGFDESTGAFTPGIIVLVTASGAGSQAPPASRGRQVADAIAFPNGMAITPDNSTLIIAESHGKRLTAFDIDADGGLSHRRVWADLAAHGGTPDGICIDADGAVWYADVPNTRCVRVREGGEVLQTVDVDRGCFACILGGADRRTLFMVVREWRGWASTTDDSRAGRLLSVPAPVSGAGWP